MNRKITSIILALVFATSLHAIGENDLTLGQALLELLPSGNGQGLDFTQLEMLTNAQLMRDAIRQFPITFSIPVNTLDVPTASDPHERLMNLLNARFPSYSRFSSCQGKIVGNVISTCIEMIRTTAGSYYFTDETTFRNWLSTRPSR